MKNLNPIQKRFLVSLLDNQMTMAQGHIDALEEKDSEFGTEATQYMIGYFKDRFDKSHRIRALLLNPG